MAFNPGHPLPGQPHPWTDPLAPVEPLQPRPDWALGMGGSLVPSPEHFPMTPEGQEDFYRQAERSALMVMQQEQAMLGDAVLDPDPLVGSDPLVESPSGVGKRVKTEHVLLLLFG
jgi:hypothetical protein